ncbi:unnamed protein product [Pneumocystis jirovecii]|uniref:Hyaluronan/mRNA-binding protein domain-containing protein n=1 Tax=Pneumocystis jirovecii TaxID=42068 RepID=L0PIM1_PNEJI|nr:unnamed protein product [Pneumocystis jirovecii]
MTRSVKAHPESGRHGFEGTAPNGTKKNGAGKANWGTEGSEIDLSEFMERPRRPSNPQSASNKWLDLEKFSREDLPSDVIEADD